MAGYKILGFKGRFPGVDNRAIPENAATVATDLKLGYGAIRPMMEPRDTAIELEPRVPGDIPKSMFLYLRDYWLQFDHAASFVMVSTFATDEQNPDRWDRVIHSVDDYTAGNEPAVRVSGSFLVYDVDLASWVEQNNVFSAGSGPYPNAWHALGVQRPLDQPVVVSTGIDGDVVDQRTVYYTITLVNSRGEEGAPCLEPSDGVVINEAGFSNTITCALPNPATTVGADDDTYLPYVKARLYRLYAEDATQTWLFVDEKDVDDTTVSFTDDRPTAELTGEALDTFDFVPPPLGLKGLRMLPNGSVVGFYKNELVFSEPWYPYAYPFRYRYATDTNIVGIGIFGSTVVVLTETQPYLAQGASPGEMTLTRMELDQSCVSARSIVEFGDRVVWAAPDGLFAIGADGISAVTGSIIDKNTWQSSFDAGNIHAYAYEGRYVAFYINGRPGFIVNPFAPDEGVIDLSIEATAAFRDLVTDTLFLSRASGDEYHVVAFDDGDTELTWAWKSKTLEFPKHVSLGRAQVLANAYPVSVSTYYLDDQGQQVAKTQGAVASSRNQIALASGNIATDWFVAITGTTECAAVIVGETTKDIAES